MSHVLVSEEWLNTLKQEIIAEIRSSKSIPSKTSSRVKSADAMKMLQCSDTKLAWLRASGKLPFTQVGRTYYYKTEDIEKLLTGGY
jgi:hypothetical protein